MDSIVCKYLHHKSSGLYEIQNLKGVLSSHKSVTGILPNNPTMLPPFSVFMNFHPNLSDSRSGVTGTQWSHCSDQTPHCVASTPHNHTHQEQGEVLVTLVFCHTRHFTSVLYFFILFYKTIEMIRKFLSAVAVLRLLCSMTCEGCVPKKISCVLKKHQLYSKEATVLHQRYDSCVPKMGILMLEYMTPEK